MTLKQAIRSTFDYAARYGRGLTEEQLCERLISDKKYQQKAISHWSQVTGCKFEKEESKICKEKIQIAKELVDKLRKFENILMVGVTGSVAAGYPTIDSDIDLMIICRKNSLWINRLMLRIWLLINRVPTRRRGTTERKDDFCFNLWVDTTALRIPSNKENQQNAIDLVMMIPLLDRENTYHKLLTANSWAKKWVATGYSQKITNVKFLISNDKKTKKITKILNWVAFWGQYLYMKPKMKREVVDLHRAYFHPLEGVVSNGEQDGYLEILEKTQGGWSRSAKDVKAEKARRRIELAKVKKLKEKW